MSLPLDYPFIETGDKNRQVEAWRLAGFNDVLATTLPLNDHTAISSPVQNTDRGRLYIDLLTVGADLKVSLYKDRDKLSLVAEGQGPKGSRIQLLEQNTSGLTGSVFVRELGDNNGTILHAAIASPRDCQERDDRFNQLLREQPVEANPFVDIMRATSRQFYIRMQEKFPPPSFYAGHLKSYGVVPGVENGRMGQRDIETTAIWNLNIEGDWELVGLENPGDYREWGIIDLMWRAWNTRVRGGDGDPVLNRVLQLRQDAEDEWVKIQPFVDFGRDGIPDYAARTTNVRSVRG